MTVPEVLGKRANRRVYVSSDENKSTCYRVDLFKLKNPKESRSPLGHEVESGYSSFTLKGPLPRDLSITKVCSLLSKSTEHGKWTMDGRRKNRHTF